jgi:cilia- and flagella-associated protein 52
VSIENLADPHGQRLLRGHDMPVSCLAVSPSGTMVASGQLGTKAFKGVAAPVFLWSVEQGRRLTVFKGISVNVNIVAFSTDERFVCGCGEVSEYYAHMHIWTYGLIIVYKPLSTSPACLCAQDCLLYVWDISTAEVIYAQKTPVPVSVLKWVEHVPVSRQYVSYELVIGFGNTVSKAQLSFDPARVQWGMKMTPYAMPPGGGVVRTFNCIDISEDLGFIYAGTGGGEVMVFKRDVVVFRAAIPVCSNGLQCLASLANGDIVCGGGDGSIRRLRGRDMSWQLVAEVNITASYRHVYMFVDDFGQDRCRLAILKFFLCFHPCAL